MRSGVPKRPAGRKSSTSTIKMKISVVEICGKKTAPTAAITPTREAGDDRAEDRARPPITTIAKVWMMIVSPIVGVTFVLGALSTPASAASATPNAKMPLTRR